MDPGSDLGAVVQSGNIYTDDLPVGLTSYKGVTGSNWGWGTFSNASVGTCCLPEYGTTADPWVAGDGIFPGGGYRCPRKFSNIVDGTSNTLMVGESTYIAGFYWGSDWAGAVGAGATASSPPNYFTTATDWANNYGFRSKHENGVQFAYADGSVRFCSNSIPLGIYRALATIAGGEAAQEP
jgi:prepilin-type processing-associated H-X9-DG protein